MAEVSQLTFLVQWLEPCSAVPREFILSYYINDGDVSMFDIKRRKLFLRKSECSTVSVENLFLGNRIVVYSRELLIKQYADPLTEKYLTSRYETVLAGINEAGFKELGNIIIEASKRKLVIRNAKLVTPSENDIEHYRKWLYIDSKKMLRDNIRANQPVILMDLFGENAVTHWKTLALSNSNFFCFGSRNPQQSAEEVKILFSENIPLHSNTAEFRNSSCCIIKPHILRDGLTGEVIDFILKNDFKITALQLFNLSREQADNFFQIYKDAFSHYNQLLDEMVSGPCIAMEISSKASPDVHKKFRMLVGPHDSELACLARPLTLRAIFGVNKVRNAVHCTDLPEDTNLELEYFFDILCKKKSLI